jgi:integrase
MMFRSAYAKRLADYIQLRRRLGYKMEKQTGVLRMFDTYIHARRHRGPLIQVLAISFATANPRVTRLECWRRYQFVRHFAEYMTVFDPHAPALDPKALPMGSERSPVRTVSERDLVRLLKAARGISSRHPILGITLHTMIGLAASTGLRIGEIVRLDRSDVDLQGGVLTIRQTKFKKDRLVPIYASTVAALRRYVVAREASILIRDPVAFFLSLRGRRYTCHTLEGALCTLGRKVGIRGATGKGPNFHSLRHRFAVQRLVAWYREGADVQAMLPVLATYMGHSNYTGTAYYLTATPELMGLAAARYHRSFPDGNRA